MPCADLDGLNMNPLLKECSYSGKKYKWFLDIFSIIWVYLFIKVTDYIQIYIFYLYFDKSFADLLLTSKYVHTLNYFYPGINVLSCLRWFQLTEECAALSMLRML
jgi:hypothetical protein